MITEANWTALHAQVHQILKQRQLLPQRQRVLVAVSGGQDSLCLLKLLVDMQPHWDWTIAVAHCNHRWRSDADANAAYVKQLTQGLQLAFHEATASESIATEAKARTWRYQALTDLASTQGYTQVVTGHTASDRAETLLFNLMRGSGADGLQALAWQRELTPGVQLVRPLLTITRAETGTFCQQANLKVWEDSTNADQRYARNRIRQTLIPYLQTHFNPQVEQALAQTAELLQSDVEYLEAAVEALWPTVVGAGISQPVSSASHLPGSHLPASCLNRIALQVAPLTLQRRLIRRFLQTLLPTAPSFEHIEKLVGLLGAANRSQTDPFPGGAIAQVQGDWIVFTAQTSLLKNQDF
jgi:tRNA(Ile)-lysidine synthase